jgi:Na+/citrate or Na+/malate symporter
MFQELPMKNKARTLIIAGIILGLLAITSTSWLGESNPEVLRQIEALVQSYGYTGVFISTIIAGSIIPLEVQLLWVVQWLLA